MPEQTITCPSCGYEISLTETLFNQVKDSVRKELEALAKKRDEALKKREEELARRAEELENTVSRKLATEREKILREAEEKARGALDVRLKGLEEENREKTKLLDEAQRMELELRKKAREIEEEKKILDLKVARTLDEEREKIRRQAQDLFSEEHRLRDMEKEKKIADLQKMIEEMKRKAEQGSMQLQGEVQELDLEEMLRSKFYTDVIEPVPKGFRGADIVEKVFTPGGQYCGSIIWESKRTKAWNDDWLTKLKDDQREVKAEVAVLVTETLPRDIASFGRMKGVWVTGYAFAVPLAETLRFTLTQVAHSKLATEGKGEKMEAIYRYISGPEFKHKVEAIVEAFKTMKDELEQEKRAVTRLWARREKQIERVIMNTVKMYGDLEGIVGATLPEIKTLELAEGEED